MKGKSASSLLKEEDNIHNRETWGKVTCTFFAGVVSFLTEVNGKDESCN